MTRIKRKYILLEFYSVNLNYGDKGFGFHHILRDKGSYPVKGYYSYFFGHKQASHFRPVSVFWVDFYRYIYRVFFQHMLILL